MLSIRINIAARVLQRNIAFTGVESDKTRTAHPKDPETRRSKAVREKTAEDMEKSSDRKSTKAHSNAVTSSSVAKRKREEERKSSSDLDLENPDRNKKCNKTSKKSHCTNLEITSTACASKEDEDTDKRLHGKRDTKTVDLFEERVEKKKQRAVMYEKYLQRGGARNPGSKEIPAVRKFVFHLFLL